MLWEFGWPQDLDVHSVWDPLAGWYAKELVVPTGESVHEDVVAKFERLARRVEQEYRRRSRSSAMPVPRLMYEGLVRETGSAYTIRGGWSVDAICDALSDWASRHAGRRDLRFEWNRDAEY